MANLCFHILDGDYSVMKWIPTRLMCIIFSLITKPVLSLIAPNLFCAYKTSFNIFFTTSIKLDAPTTNQTANFGDMLMFWAAKSY